MYGTLSRSIDNTLDAIYAEWGIPFPAPKLVPCPTGQEGHLTFNGCLKLASILKRSPKSIAADIAEVLEKLEDVASVVIAGSGYLNLSFTNAAIVQGLYALEKDATLGIPQVAHPSKIIVDFGGPNIKPMHVGHMRSLFIGEAVRQLLKAQGHQVISDIHLGDWGLPSGMILSEIQKQHPDAPWFTDGGGNPYPSEIPLTVEDLAEIYPRASQSCKSDENQMAKARALTASLQEGHAGLVELWNAIVCMAKSKIREICGRMNVHFDLWLGESDASPQIGPTIEMFRSKGLVTDRDGAAYVEVLQESDRRPVPPLFLSKADGSALYATTDLATLKSRIEDFGAEQLLYVVDARQELHFMQVFRAARLSGLVTTQGLEHIAFGTVNGADGKPFRTRDGGVMGLEALLDMACNAAKERLLDGHKADGWTSAQLEKASDEIGMAALRIADLTSDRSGSYKLDVERATSFEGKTGPYLLYALVRLRALLAKAGLPASFCEWQLSHPAEIELAMKILGFGNAVEKAANDRAPHLLVDWMYGLATAVSRFYVQCPVLTAEEPLKSSRLHLCELAEKVLGHATVICGCRAPEAM